MQYKRQFSRTSTTTTSTTKTSASTTTVTEKAPEKANQTTLVSFLQKEPNMTSINNTKIDTLEMKNTTDIGTNFNVTEEAAIEKPQIQDGTMFNNGWIMALIGFFTGIVVFGLVLTVYFHKQKNSKIEDKESSEIEDTESPDEVDLPKLNDSYDADVESILSYLVHETSSIDTNFESSSVLSDDAV